MHLVLCQPDISWEDKDATRARVRSLLSTAAIAPGALVVLPEMFATGFSMNAEATAEEPGGSTERFLQELAAEHQCCLLAGLITRWNGAPRNQSVAVAPGGEILARYTKQRPFSPALEQASYPGGQGPSVFEWGGFRIAPLICYDLRFPEVFRAAAGAGATLFAVLANWPAPRHHHWSALLMARAIENQAAVVGVNRAGRDPGHVYAGGSQVLDAQGRLLIDAGTEEAVVTTVLDPADVTSWRDTFPALRDAGLA